MRAQKIAAALRHGGHRVALVAEDVVQKDAVRAYGADAGLDKLLFIEQRGARGADDQPIPESVVEAAVNGQGADLSRLLFKGEVCRA
jgi:hypothetical protein